MERIKNSFLYAGVDKESFLCVLPDIEAANRAMVAVFSGIAIMITAVMFVISFFVRSFSPNRGVYVAGFFGVLLLCGVAIFYAKYHRWIITVLVYITFSIFFVYGIVIGTITNPGQQTVTFIVMLVFMPVLFIDRPIRTASAMLIYVLIFIGLCLERKTGGVRSTDILDAIIYGVVGAVSGAIITHIKVRSYVLERKLQDASRYDQLTSMNNRNSFEIDLINYPSQCKENLACIYVDVNGLHELNNSKGHKMGDIMLQFVAQQVRDIFGLECSYRIGGDEFVAFAPDLDENMIARRIEQLNSAVEGENYHIAVGYCFMKKAGLDMDELIKQAESRMYENKSQFYRNGNRDRRNRQ